MNAMADDSAEIFDDLYLGVRAGIDPATVPGGSWYFDSGDGTLICRVANPRFLETDLPGPSRIRFRIVEQAKGNAPHLALKPLDPYRWVPSR